MRWCLLFLLLAACGLKQPESERVRKTIASWDGALALTAVHWTRGDLPKHFVKDAAEAASEELSKQTYGHAAAHALAMAHGLDDAAERDDKNSAARIARELEAESKELQKQ